MFYCYKCKEEKGWIKSLNQSFGKCEICETTSNCNDVPSHLLTLPE